MKRLIACLFLVSLATLAQPADPSKWRRNADGSISPKGGKSVAISPTLPPSAPIGSTLILGGDGSVPVPRYVKPGHIAFTEYANVVADWIIYGAGVSKAADTANYIHSPTFQNVKISATSVATSPYVTKTLSAPQDFSAKQLAFYYYIPENSGIQYIHLHFDSSASADAFTDYYNTGPIYRYDSPVAGHTGWHLWVGSAAATNYWAAAKHGSPNWANIKYIRIRATTDGTNGANFTAGPIFAYTPPNSKGLIVLAMDGSYSGQAKAVAYANSKGIPVTLFTTANAVAPAVGRLSIAQLQDIKRWGPGNLIASYINPFGTYWQNMDLATQIRAVQTNAVWLRQNGFSDGARICSPPSTGLRTVDTYRSIFNAWCDVPAGFNSAESTTVNTLWDLRSIYANLTPGSIADPALASGLADAVSGKTVFVSLWHSPYDAIDGTQANWETHVDAIAAQIAAGTVEAITPADLLSGRIALQ